jgi:hypothetical protein
LSYRQKIAAWVGNFLNRREQGTEADANIMALVSSLGGPGWDAGVDDLMRALGGKYLTLKVNGDDERWRFDIDKSYQGCSEPVFRYALEHALRLHAAGGQASDQAVAIFDLLSEKDRWRCCLTSVESAYAFALLMIHMAYLTSDVDMTTPFAKLALPRVVSGFKKITKPWLGVEVGLSQRMGGEQMAALLFGQVWCDFMLSDTETAAWRITLIVERHRPPFAPGLLAHGVEVPSEDLPDLSIGVML